MFSAVPIKTCSEVYAKWIIISSSSLLLPWAIISFHPQCYHQCLSFFQNTCEIELFFQTLSKFLSKCGVFIRYCIACFVYLVVFSKWKQSLPVFLFQHNKRSKHHRSCVTQCVFHQYMLLILFFSAKQCHFNSREEGIASPSMQVGMLDNGWVYPTQLLGKTGEMKASLVIARYQLLILATQQHFWE